MPWRHTLQHVIESTKHNIFIYVHAYQCFYGSRVTSEAAPNKKCLQSWSQQVIALTLVRRDRKYTVRRDRKYTSLTNASGETYSETNGDDAFGVGSGAW